MGRAIENEKDIDMLKKEVEQLKTAFSGLSATVEQLQGTATTKTHIDLHEGVKTNKKKKTARVVEEAEA